MQNNKHPGDRDVSGMLCFKSKNSADIVSQTLIRTV